ncbi:MAG TPA: histidine kinase [Steroidobacteraceae bacterium]|nr:histidine kinase [Steroidobacteraceae bacterium]
MDATSPTPPGSAPSARAPGERLAFRRAELLLIFGFWTVIALLTAANALLDPRGRSPLTAFTGAPFALAFTSSYLWALLTPLIFWMASRYPLERTNWVWRVLLYFAVGIAVAIFVDVSVGWLRLNVFHILPRRPASEVAPIARVTRFWFMNEFLVYIAVLAAGFARDYFLRYRARREETIRLQAHAAQLQAQLADARLATLRTQLDPHFLFNTLHAVSALVEHDPRGVRRMIARLSELLRNSLEGADEPEIPLQQEIALLRRYLEIMEIRFRGRLEIEIEVDPEVESALVPNLILQPLAENAIKHGVSKIDGTGRIGIHAARSGEQLILRVQDNGPGLAGQAALNEGLGMRNTRERLQQLYGAASSATLRAAEGGGVIAEVVLPYHTRLDLPGAKLTAQAGGYRQ